MRYKVFFLSLAMVCLGQTAFGAIAFDVASGASGAGSTLGGTNNAGTFMLGFVSINNLVDTPSCTWQGDTMTLFETSLDGTAYKNWGFYLVNPDLGAGTMSCSGSSAIIDMRWLTYTGVASLEADSHVDQASGTSLTCNVTTLTDNAWTVQYVLADQGGPLAAGSGSTLRDSIRSDSWGFFDSNGPISPQGSHNMSTTMANGASTCIIASLAPSGGGSTPGSGPFDISTSTATTTAQLIGTVQMGLGIIIVIMMVYLIAYLYNSLFRKKQWQH